MERSNEDSFITSWASQVVLLVMDLPARRLKRRGFNPRVRKIPWRRSATHSSILAWRIPWTEEPGGLQSMVSQSQTQLKRLSTCTQYQEKSDIFWYLVMAVTCLGMTVKSIYQSSPGCVPLVWMDLIWRPLRSLVLRLFIAQVRQISAIWLIILFIPGVTMTSTNQL